MTVQCPRCRTQYKIPTTRISEPRPVFKCTRCSLVFSGDGERGPRSAGRAKEDKNLALPFSTRKERPARTPADELGNEDDPTIIRNARDEVHEPDAAEDDTIHEEAVAEEADEDIEEDEEEEREPAPTSRRDRRAPRAREIAARDKDPVAEPAFVARAARERIAAPPAQRASGRRKELRVRDEEDDLEDDGPSEDLRDDEEPKRSVLSASEGKQRRPAINPRRGIRSATAASSGRSPVRTVAIWVAAISVVYLGFAVALDRRPEAAIVTLSRVPILGRLLGGDHLLVWRLQLSNVEGGLDQIKGARPAYVVSGRALNTTNEDLRVIEIEGRLLVNGVEQRRQTVYAANQQRKTIQDLSPSEVEMLLRLEPNRRFVIRPGESASFLLVFPNPPPGTTEVTCRVLDARTA